jgi:ribosome maturation factor RimP
MAIKDQIIELVTPALQEQSFYLEDIHIVTPGNHRIVTCIVDGDLALNLDQVTSASRIISEMLDAAAFMGESPFTLEVTSRGVDRPLTLPRHFAKSIDRLLKITKVDGSELKGRVLSNSEDSVTLLVTTKKVESEEIVALSEIKRAVVEVEFNRKDDK